MKETTIAIIKQSNTMTLENQFFLYKSHAAYSIIRTADHSYRDIKTTYSRFAKEFALLFSTPTAFAIKHLFRFLNARIPFRIQKIKDTAIKQDNFIIYKQLHDKLQKLTLDSRQYDINQVPNQLRPVLHEINQFYSMMAEYEQALRLKLYPSDFKGASLSEILEQRKRLEAFADDWDDDEISVYDTTYLPK